MIKEKANTMIRQRNREMKKAAVRHRDSRDSPEDLTILLSTKFSWFSWAFTSSVFRGWISASESLLSITAHSSVFRHPSPPSLQQRKEKLKYILKYILKTPIKIFCYYLIFTLETFNGRWANQCIVTELDTTHCWCRRSPTQSNGESPWNAGTTPILPRGGNKLC